MYIITRNNDTTTYKREKKDLIRVTHLLSSELTVTAFDNALSLSERVNLCLALQHHLMVLLSLTSREDGGETHLFGHVIDI
jgi:hypothetical protein